MSFNEQFTEILRAYPDSVTNRKKFVGLLRDFFPREAKRTRLLINLHEVALPDEITRAKAALDDKFAYRYVKRLVEEYGVEERNAVWAVRAWCECYGGGILGLACQINVIEDSFAYAIDWSEDDDFSANDTAALPAVRPSNASRTSRTSGIAVPCTFGAGNGDYGYCICGIIPAERCKHRAANVYAVIYNYLLRSTRINDDNRPTYFKEMKTLFAVDYANVFRLVTIILQLIKNNYITDTDVNFRYDGDAAELRCALLLINNYADIFCRLIGVSACAPLRMSAKNKAIAISLTERVGVYTQSNNVSKIDRELWLGQRINYHLTKNNIKDLEYILSEISTFHAFREGQFDALCKLSASDEHAVCVMPSGKGKSVILCLATLLQPVPIAVIAPDNALIHNQIDNLANVHNFDNAMNIRAENGDSGGFTHSLIFMVYEQYEQYSAQNDANHISCIMLDETHCLSNWRQPLSYEKIGDLAASDVLGAALAKLDCLNRADTYLYGFDLAVFLSQLWRDNDFDGIRLDRIITNTAKKDFLSLCTAVAKVYSLCSDEIRLKIHRGLGERLEQCGMSPANLFNLIYLSAKKDLVYYGILAAKLNPLFKK
ncbi:MAG: hypothetical protein FWG45_05565 [Oscillospiraceae bacterium]|nr:hypothetical protein [Oscillospiraceae bacterium]